MTNAFPSMKATLPRVFLPVPADRWPRRVIQLFTGLSLFGIGMAMQVRAAFGLDPWNVLHEGLGDPKYRACPLLKRMVAAGELGRKSGRGFYAYSS